MAAELDAQRVREWGERYSNWGRWGREDRRGTLNFLTRARVLAACALPRAGRVFSCALPPERCGPPDATADPPHARLDGRAAQGGGERDAAPPPGSRWDPPASVARDGKRYNDRDAAAEGAPDAMAEGVVGRGVLLDLPRVARVPWLEDGRAVLPRELDACAEACGVAVEPGDIVLVRTGRLARSLSEDSWQAYAGGASPGLSVHCARWLFEREAAAVASDTACVEVLPSEAQDCALPLHQMALRDTGLHFGETFFLDELAAACAEDGNYAFLFAAAPLPVARAARPPVHPLAVK